MTNVQRNIIIGILVTILAVVLYCAYMLSLLSVQEESVEEVQDESSSDITYDSSSYLLESLTPEIQHELGARVFSAIEKKTNGDWDKILDIIGINDKQNAAYGSWFAWDEWSWVAWRKEGGVWEVLVNTDMFECDAVARIPAEQAMYLSARFENVEGNGITCK